MGQAFPRGAKFSLHKVLTHATVEIATVTIVFIHEEIALPPGRIEGHGCSASCVPGCIHRQAASVVSTTSGAGMDTFLSIQRTGSHRLGVGFRIWIQRAVAKHSHSANSTTTTALSFSTSSNLQICRGLQSPIVMDR